MKAETQERRGSWFTPLMTSGPVITPSSAELHAFIVSVSWFLPLPLDKLSIPLQYLPLVANLVLKVEIEETSL